MQKLSASVVNNGKKTTLIELYTEKQTRYTQVVAEKTKAFRQAREDAQQVYTNPKDVRVAYEKWVEEHARTYRNYVQAAYMDWVVTGKKEEVEFYFAVVDQDTAMARVEQSKVILRYFSLLPGRLIYPRKICGQLLSRTLTALVSIRR